MKHFENLGLGGSSVHLGLQQCAVISLERSLKTEDFGATSKTSWEIDQNVDIVD